VDRGKEMMLFVAVSDVFIVSSVVIVVGSCRCCCFLFFLFFRLGISESSKKPLGFPTLFLLVVDQRTLVAHFLFMTFKVDSMKLE